jgi:hypothetical protein
VPAEHAPPVENPPSGATTPVPAMAAPALAAEPHAARTDVAAADRAAAETAHAVAAAAPPAPSTSAAAATTPAAAATTPATAATTPAAGDGDATAKKVAALIDGDKLADAERILMAQAILEPKAGWVHLQMGEIYFRRLWRKDAEREWDQALQLDRALRSDARLGQRLCTALGPTWNGAGQRLILRHLGAQAVAPLTACIREANDLGRLQTAARLIERVAGPGKVDRNLVATRTAELSGRRR